MLRMQNFQGIIFTSTETYREIFISAFVHLLKIFTLYIENSLSYEHYVKDFEFQTVTRKELGSRVYTFITSVLARNSKLMPFE